MITFAFIAATALSAPTMSEVQQQRLMERFLRSASRDVIVRIEVDVTPEGRTANCRLLEYHGDERASRQICPAMERARFEPATGTDGIEQHGRLELEIATGQYQGSTFNRADITLAVAALPGGEERADVFVRAMFDAQGEVVACEANDLDAIPALVDAACGEVVQLEARSFLDAEGEAVPFVQSIRVAFETS